MSTIIGIQPVEGSYSGSGIVNSVWKSLVDSYRSYTMFRVLRVHASLFMPYWSTIITESAETTI